MSQDQVQNATPRIHVLLPVHNRRATTEKFIRCLLAQTYGNWHLILIDDGSKDGTEAMARALAPGLTVLRGTGDWWWGGALHQGYQWLQRENLPSGDLVLIANDDTEFGPEFLANAVSALRPHSLMLAQLYDQQGNFLETGVHWDWRDFACTGVSAQTGFNCFSTRGLFLSVADFMEIGGFYPKLLPHYLSDYEFTLRAVRKGFTLMTAPDVKLTFDEALTGIRSTEGYSVLKAMRTNLSIRSAANPLYWTSFVLLASPARYRVLNVVRVWWRFLEPVRNRVGVFFAPVTRFLEPVRRFLGRVKRRLKREWAARNGVAR